MNKAPFVFNHCNVEIIYGGTELTEGMTANYADLSPVNPEAAAFEHKKAAPLKPTLVKPAGTIAPPQSREIVPSILMLAIAMQRRLDQFKDAKDGWASKSNGDLFEALYKNIEHLRSASKGDTSLELVKEYAGDAANYIMMIADNMGTWGDW